MQDDAARGTNRAARRVGDDSDPFDRGSGAPPPGRLPAQAQVVDMHRSYCVATWGYMLIAVINGAVRGERVRPMVEAARRNCRRFPKGGGFMLIIGPNTGLPEAEARKLTSETLAELGDYIHSAAVVVDWDGFRAATARSAVTTLFFATGRRLSMKVFKSVEDAVEWQTGRVHNEPAFDAAQYRAVVEDLRRRQSAFRRADDDTRV